jgi:hypothetical protein
MASEAELNKRRKETEEFIYGLFNKLDPSGANTEFYREKFSKMNLKQFAEFMTKLESPNNWLMWQIIDYEKNINMKVIEDAANYIGIPLYERIAYPHLSDDPNNPIMSYEPVPVLYLHLKPMQQMRTKKNSTSTEITKRNKFNQVTGEDKNGQSSDIENYALVALGAEKILKELLSARADDSVMKNEMLSNISRDGYCSLSDLTDDIKNKVALNMIDVYLMSMGLQTDLINKSLILQYTADKNR